MWSRKLEEKIEAIRKEMEKVAMDQGITHPQVYELSLQLDQLHNQWQKEHMKKKREKKRSLRERAFQVKESNVPLYQTIQGIFMLTV